jgi:hypothetical protein
MIGFFFFTHSRSVSRSEIPGAFLSETE